MNIYKFEIGGETELITGESLIHALKGYKEITGLGLDSFEDDDIIEEFTEDKWDSSKVYYEEEEKTFTVREILKQVNHPTILSSTAY